MNARANTTWQTALLCAVDQTKSAFALSLLSQGADAQVEDQHGLTLLHKACTRQMRSVVTVLIYGGLINWRMEDWLDMDIHHSGVNPNLLAGYPANIPSVLLHNVQLFNEIMAVRQNALSLQSLSRRVIRQALQTQLQDKLDSIYLPGPLKRYLLFK